MPLMSAHEQERIDFSVSIHKMKVALEQVQRSVAIVGNSLTRTFKTWADTMERAGIDVEKLKGVRYEKPVIIDDPIPHPNCRMSLAPIFFKVPVPLRPPPKWVQDDIAKLTGRVLAELGPGPGRDA